MKFAKACIALFSENKITQAAAALSYYLTMTFFPLLIIVYALLGDSYERIMQLMEFGERLLAKEIMDFIRDFLLYIDSGNRDIMLPIGFAVLLSYASAALRSLQNTIGSIQGGAEYRGVRSYIASIIYSLMLLGVSYFALIVMLAGRGAVERISGLIPGLSFLLDWVYLRYLLLAGILFLLLLGLYHVPKRREDKYRVLPGAALSSGGVLLISPLFSMFMSRSVKYSLVYGSIASLILLMLWLYMCCMVVCLGAVFNVALYKMKNPQA